MKLAFTIADATHAYHIGGEVQRETHIVEVPDEWIPQAVKDCLNVELQQTSKRFESLSVSVVREAEAGK